MQSTAPDVNARDQNHVLHVMVGILRDADARILISRRHGNVHLSGYWEFPGGKLEPGESAFAGLARELHEELGVCVEAARPLTQVRHRFPERSVLLDVWHVDAFSNSAKGREGQEIAWAGLDELGRYRFPESNRAILRALRLAAHYPITPNEPDPELVLDAVCGYLDAGNRLIQFRAPGLTPEVWKDAAHEALALCRERGALLILNATPHDLNEVPADGIHLSAAQLMKYATRSVGPEQLLGASCHNAEELRRAAALGVDYVTVSPVHRTQSHPDQLSMGWEHFSDLVMECEVPVYALGGVAPKDLNHAQSMGAWGVAGIRAFR